MVQDFSVKENSIGEIIHSEVLNGPTQMAFDVMMLNRVKHNTDLSIRFYKWERPCLSLGRNQTNPPQRWLKLAKQKKIEIIRRPSGGSAVLHSGGITYALAWKSPPRKRHLAYREATQWLRNCFKELGVNLDFGDQPLAIPSGNCFSTSSIADLVDENGIKRIGSAQFWKRGNLLQHGEILLDPPVDLWTKIFNSPPPPPISPKIPRIDLENLLTASITAYWSNVKWSHKSFEINQIDKLHQNSKIYLI